MYIHAESKSVQTRAAHACQTTHHDTRPCTQQSRKISHPAHTFSQLCSSLLSQAVSFREPPSVHPPPQLGPFHKRATQQHPANMKHTISNIREIAARMHMSIVFINNNRRTRGIITTNYRSDAMQQRESTDYSIPSLHNIFPYNIARGIQKKHCVQSLCMVLEIRKPF